MIIDHRIKIILKKKRYIIYIEKKILFKQEIIRKSLNYTYFYIIHVLIKLGLIK